MIDGWKYYNHAAIPTCAPHEMPDLTPIENGAIWHNLGGGTPLLARWTEDFDCDHETQWWYLIRETPYEAEKLSRKSRKNIRYGLNHCKVEIINPSDYIDELYTVYCKAQEKYENADNKLSKKDFNKQTENSTLVWWAGFSIDGLLIGYVTVIEYEEYVGTSSAKFWPEYQNLRVSDALYHSILEHYLNGEHYSYVSSGTRNINHKTNTQEYKIEHFAFKRVYCKLKIEYNPKIRWLIRLLYPFRAILNKLDSNTKIHQVNAVLLMESFARDK